MLAQFPNGSYVEGFVTLTQVAADGSALTDPIDLGLPFLAFYGDWTKAPIMDSTDYWETLDGSASQAQAYMNTAFSSSSENTVDTYLGDNNYTTVPYLADRNAISPNNDDFMDSLTGIYTGLLRNTKSLKYTITGANGQVYYSKDCERWASPSTATTITASCPPVWTPNMTASSPGTAPTPTTPSCPTTPRPP